MPAAQTATRAVAALELRLAASLRRAASSGAVSLSLRTRWLTEARNRVIEARRVRLAMGA